MDISSTQRIEIIEGYDKLLHEVLFFMHTVKYVNPSDSERARRIVNASCSKATEYRRLTKEKDSCSDDFFDREYEYGGE